jgi:hypothetical protein
MSRRDLQLLDDYEVIGQPVVSATGLAYVPWLVEAVKPYNATRLPHCTVHGLWDALRGAGGDAGSASPQIA